MRSSIRAYLERLKNRFGTGKGREFVCHERPPVPLLGGPSLRREAPYLFVTAVLGLLKPWSRLGGVARFRHRLAILSSRRGYYFACGSFMHRLAIALRITRV